METKEYKWEQMEVSVICLIVKAFRELYENDKNKFYTITEFCNILNMRPFHDVTIKQIKKLIPKIAKGHLITENHLNKGSYRWEHMCSKGLTD
jgi:20S proteasome alpha/beta subunit